MVSRRSVRVKVMQLLYAKNRDEDLTDKQALKDYDLSIQQSFHMYLFNLYVLLETTRMSVQEVEKKKTKHLPSADDQKFTDKLFSNELIQSLVQSGDLERKFEKLQFDKILDKDVVKRMYRPFSKTDEYKKYILKESSLEDHRAILLDLFRHMRKNENFADVMEDHFTCWTDDKSLAIGAIKKTIKKAPVTSDTFYEEFSPDAETAEEFGRELMKVCIEQDGELLDMIKPTLKNWDADRLAIIDMILLKMALAEFLHFQTIPTKVTLNEYVEISKAYSTPKSKDFINGILDKLMKSLDAEGKINKEGRGLIT